jgi:predicted flap endonuclease-1-like 5' DNA nuclease
MMYLFWQLVFPWLLIALVLGIAVGWWSCKAEPRVHGFGWLTWGIVLFICGLIAAALKLVPGVAGLWLDMLLWLFFAYIVGCFIGCLGGQVNLFGSSGLDRMALAGTAGAAVAAAAPKPVAAAAPPPKPVGPAAVMPYQWQAAKDANAVTLTGYVPSDAARSKVVANAKAAAAPLPVIDKLQLGSGAPGGLESMADAASGHLARLDKGIASLIDSRYTLTGVAGTQGNYDAVMSAVKALPAGFALAKVDIVAPPAPKMAPVVAAAPVAAVAAVAKPADPPPAPALADEGKVPGKRPPGFASPRGGKADDLKRIRGIGKQNEGRLHGLGIWHFDQVSKWSADQALWVGSYLAFPGRIEREEWIKQAAILATGADTEFSKRVDKGEVATSKDDGSLGKGNVEKVEQMRPARKPPAKK